MSIYWILLVVNSIVLALSLAVICLLKSNPRLKWTWDWKVTVGFAMHHNLAPEFIWIWEQYTPPPWKRN